MAEPTKNHARVLDDAAQITMGLRRGALRAGGAVAIAAWIGGLCPLFRCGAEGALSSRKQAETNKCGVTTHATKRR
ncbi:hypothetical protein [Sorangium sp. So ce1151]|uniref:hypothetical protein n=1 Tax=Sorangium sp. So ce1151 TaxID=3133332 RepID=UPI003F5FA1EA